MTRNVQTRALKRLTLPGPGCTCTPAGFGHLTWFLSSLFFCEAFLNDFICSIFWARQDRDVLYHKSSFTGAGLDQDGGFGNITPYLGSEQKFFYHRQRPQLNPCLLFFPVPAGCLQLPDKHSFQRAHRPSVLPKPVLPSDRETRKACCVDPAARVLRPDLNRNFCGLHLIHARHHPIREQRALGVSCLPRPLRFRLPRHTTPGGSRKKFPCQNNNG